MKYFTRIFGRTNGYKQFICIEDDLSSGVLWDTSGSIVANRGWRPLSKAFIQLIKADPDQFTELTYEELFLELI